MKWIVGLLALALLVALTAVGGVFWLQAEAQRPLELPADGIVYQLQPGTSIRALGRDLEEKGVIGNRWVLELWSRWQGGERAVRTGEYRFAPGLSVAQLLEKLQRGEMVQHKFTITEGSTFRQIAQGIAELAAEGLVRKTTEPDKLPAAFVQWTGLDHPEGWIFPDTYLFARGISDKDLLLLAHRGMKETLGSTWDRRKANLPFTTPYEALVMASIVEKETGVPEERPMIAGVFINRLRKNMMLQTDPTVIYGMGEDYQGNIRKADLQTDTPYNTYTRFGLPPTPIAMPSKAAIEAVLNPELTDALYFVAKGGGAHHFSRTYEEHRNAVVRHQLGGSRERYTGDQGVSASDGAGVAAKAAEPERRRVVSKSDAKRPATSAKAAVNARNRPADKKKR